MPIGTHSRRGSGAVAAIALAALAALTAAMPAPARADAAAQQEIRALEQAQARAAIEGDRAGLLKIFAADFVLVNPAGAITSLDELMALLTGGTPYRSARYETQRLTDLGDTIVTIGLETVVPNQGPQAGREQQRRVTHVWHHEGGAWRLKVRHAHVPTP